MEEINFELRGDEQGIIEEIKKYIPIEREDIWSWLMYFQNEVREPSGSNDDELTILENEIKLLREYAKVAWDFIYKSVK